jgi:hypothetical protein
VAEQHERVGSGQRGTQRGVTRPARGGLDAAGTGHLDGQHPHHRHTQLGQRVGGPLGDPRGVGLEAMVHDQPVQPQPQLRRDIPGGGGQGERVGAAGHRDRQLTV